MRIRLAIGILLLICGIIGCSDDELTAPEWRSVRPSDDVMGFVAQEEFSPIEYIHQVMNWNEVELFRVAYGEGLDCPAGCFYSMAVGLNYDGRVGWLGFRDSHEYVPDSTRFFDFLETDVLLFDADTWFTIMLESWYVCFDMLLPALAHDEHTSRDGLLTLSTLIYSHESVEIAEYLVANPTVMADTEILGILANLPIIRWDVYAEVRSRAQELLSGLG